MTLSISDFWQLLILGLPDLGNGSYSWILDYLLSSLSFFRPFIPSSKFSAGGPAWLILGWLHHSCQRSGWFCFHRLQWEVKCSQWSFSQCLQKGGFLKQRKSIKMPDKLMFVTVWATVLPNARIIDRGTWQRAKVFLRGVFKKEMIFGLLLLI